MFVRLKGVILAGMVCGWMRVRTSLCIGRILQVDDAQHTGNDNTGKTMESAFICKVATSREMSKYKVPKGMHVAVLAATKSRAA